MQRREQTVLKQHKLISKHHLLKQYKDHTIKIEYQLRRRLNQLEELTKFVNGDQYGRKIGHLKEQYQGFKDLLAEVKELRGRGRPEGQLEEFKVDNQRLKGEVVELEMKKEIEKVERERLRKEWDHLDQYLQQVEEQKQRLEQSFNQAGEEEDVRQQEEQTDQLIGGILNLQFSPPLSEDQLNLLRQGDFAQFIHYLTSRSKWQLSNIRQKEADLKQSYAQLQHLKRRSREMGGRDAEQYAQLQREDQQLDAEIAILERDIHRSRQETERIEGNLEQVAQESARRDAMKWWDRKKELIENNRKAIRGYLQLSQSSNNPEMREEIEDITVKLEQLQEELRRIDRPMID